MAINYEVRVLPRAKKLTLRIQKNGTVLVTVPRFTPRFFINQFVQSHSEWIAQAQQIKTKKATQFVNKNSLMIFGKTYPLQLSYTVSASKVLLKGNTLSLFFHQTLSARSSASAPSFDPDNFPPVLTRFLQQTAQHYLTQRTKTLAKKMKVTYSALRVKAMKTRWGSCSSDGNLNFNWKLVHFSPEIIDSVIVHELAHRVHMNHSAQFWSLVEKYDPQYRIHRGWLKRQGSQID